MGLYKKFLPLLPALCDHSTEAKYWGRWKFSYTRGFTTFTPWYKYYIKSIIGVWSLFLSLFRLRYILGYFGDSKAFWGAGLRRRVRSLSMDISFTTVRLSPYFDTQYSFELVLKFHQSRSIRILEKKIMIVLLNSGMSDSREEAVENQLVLTDTKDVAVWWQPTLLQISKPTYFN